MSHNCRPRQTKRISYILGRVYHARKQESYSGYYWKTILFSSTFTLFSIVNLKIIISYGGEKMAHECCTIKTEYIKSETGK